jgi:signal transduction histidine kinase
MAASNTIGKELKILMLEDLEDDAALLDRILTKERIPFTRIRVDKKQEFIKALNEFDPDVILSDHALPQFNSIEALKIAQANKPGVPFIIVTGTVSEEFAVSCLKKGANDYILKSNLSRLPSAISHAIHEHRNNQVQKEQGETLSKQHAALIKVNKELDSFIFNVSHSLRSPVASLIGLVNIAKLDDAKNLEAADRYLTMIGATSAKLDDTLKEIMDYSQNLRTDLQISEINLQALCDSSFAGLEHLKNFGKIEKQFEIKSSAAFYSDSHRLAVILSDILSNSIKYSDNRKNNQFIRIEATISPGNAVLSVLDNGVGIHSDDLPNVFNMFVRLSNGSNHGSGLGLFVAKEVIEKLRGTVAITSAYQEWTRVEVTLPNLATMISAPSC